MGVCEKRYKAAANFAGNLKGDIMRADELKRGNEIERRLYELEKMQKWLEDVENRNVSVIATGCTVNDTVMLSTDMRTVILGMCIGEKSRLEKEFENL